MASPKLEIIVSAKDNTSAALGKARAGIESISTQLARMRNLFIGLQGAMGLQAGVSGLVRLTDAVNLANARLRQATDSMQQFGQAQALALRLSAETGAGYESIAALYSRLSLTAKDYGLTQERIAAVTEITARALKVSGAGAAESASVITQLSQALGSGVLRGEEFNAIMENGGRLAKALAAGLGLPIGKLRSLAEQGLLTTDVVVKALESQRAAIAAEARAMPNTVGASLAALRDAFGQTLARMDQASGASSALGAALSALARQMDTVAATGLVAAVSAVTVALVRKAQAVWTSIQTTYSEVIAERQAIATSIAHARARVSYATAELAAARAAVASTSGMQRLSVVQSALVPAQQRLAVAQAELSAALTTSTIAARGLSTALAVVGGPVGLITLLLTAGATAWALWGSSASRAADKAKDAINRARDVMERYKKEQQFGTGDAGAINEGIAAQQVKIKAIEAQYKQAARLADQFDPLGAKQSMAEFIARNLKAAQAELASLRKAKVEIAQRDAQNATPGAPTALGRELMKQQFDAYVAQYRDKAGQLQAAITELQARAKDAGVSRDSAEYQKALAAIRAKFATKGEKVAKGEDLSSATLSAVRAQADAEFALIKDGLARAQTAYDAALGQHLVSIKGYYAAKTALDQRAIEAEISRARDQLDAQQRIAATGKSESDRLRARGEVAKIEADLINLNNKRTDVEIANAGKAAAAERALADALAQARGELLDLTGAATAADRRAAIARSYADLRASLEAENNAAGVSLIDRLIDVKAAKAALDQLQAEWSRAVTAMQTAEQATQAQVATGLLTEMQGREQIVQLHKDAGAQLDALLPRMEALARASENPDAIAGIARLKLELQGLRQVADETATRINGSVMEGVSSMFSDLITGAKSASEAFRSFAKSVLNSMAQILSQRLAKQLLGGSTGGGLGGLFSLGLKAIGLATGGPVPGSGSGDTVPAMLTPGEYVIRQDAVQRFGLGFFEAVNGLRLPQPVLGGRLAFAAGGPVPAVSQAATQAAPVRLELSVHPDALRLTLADWLEGEIARVVAKR